VIKLFINRPVLATAVLMLILLAGILGIISLPVNHYPEISPPIVTVGASLPGASADMAKQAVASIIEQNLNGTPKMQYMESTCTNTGGVNIKLTFAADANPDIAAVDVQNRVKKAEVRLPFETIEKGITVEKQGSTMLMMIAVHSDRPEYDYTYLSNFTTISIFDFIKRVPGVGGVSNLATRYFSMRVWLNPARMASLDVTVTDIRNAIKEQNSDKSAGTVGTQPTDGVSLFFPLITGGRLESVQDFEDVMIRTSADGSTVLLKDVARLELGSSDYNKTSRYDGKEATIISVSLLPKANPVATAKAIRQVLAENAKDFPKGISYSYVYDYGASIKLWLGSVVRGLVIAFIIIIFALAIILRNLRAVLVIACALPVIFIGAFALFGIFDLTLNMMSLLGVLLSMGLCLDDVIMIVYRTRRCLSEERHDAKGAALSAAQSLMQPVVVTALLLIAVFGVIGFMGGIPGKLFREFSYAMASCIFVSAILSISLVPALCALLLRKKDAYVAAQKEGLFMRMVTVFAKVPLLGFVCWLMITGGAGWLAKTTPTAFLPDEDHGYIFAEIVLPDGAAFSRTSAAMDRMESYLMAHPAVDHIVSIKGVSARVGVLDSRGHFLVLLKPWAQRTAAGMDVRAIMKEAGAVLNQVPEAVTLLFSPPTIPGLGAGNGFLLKLQDRSGRNWDGLVEVTETFLAESEKSRVIFGVSTNMQASMPQIGFSVDERKTKALGIPVKDVYTTCSTLLTSAKVNDFNLGNRVYEVKLQADQAFRQYPGDIRHYYVRSGGGDMVPISALTEMEIATGPGAKSRYNMFDAVTVMGYSSPGFSSGEAIEEVQAILKRILPPGFGFQWSGITDEEIKASKQMAPMLLLVVVLVIILLAALLNSWILPFAVLPGITVALLGAFVALWLTGMKMDLYFQISLLALLGFAVKQASTTVSQAGVSYSEGLSPMASSLNAINARMFPVLLSLGCFLLGLSPFLFAEGAGAQTRRIFSVGVIGGGISMMVFGIMVTAVFTYIILSFQNWISPNNTVCDQENI